MEQFLEKNSKKYPNILINDIYSNISFLEQKLIIYDNTIIIQKEDYEINNFDFIFQKLSKTKSIHKSIPINRKFSKIKEVIKITRSVLPKYIYNHYKYIFKNEIKPSNAFIKLFEILNRFPLLLHNKNNYNTLHLAEAPGNFIIATNFFIKFQNNNASHNFFANSLNPNITTDKFNGFGDDFGLIKRHPNNWLFGKDNTGDITNVNNILDIKNKLKDYKLDFITGDAGLGHMDNKKEYAYLIEKLDFAQMVSIATLSTIGTNCVVKIFLNYFYSNEYMKTSSGLYTNIIYIYMCMFKQVYLTKPPNSSENSGEYYIVGLDFIGLDYEKINNLHNILNNFELNQPFIPKNLLTEEFLSQINYFFKKIVNKLRKNITKQIILHHCHNIKYKKYTKLFDCDLFYDKDKYENIVNAKIQSWIHENNFFPNNIFIDI